MESWLAGFCKRTIGQLGGHMATCPLPSWLINLDSVEDGQGVLHLTGMDSSRNDVGENILAAVNSATTEDEIFSMTEGLSM